VKTAVVLALAIFSQAVGNVFLTRGMKTVSAIVATHPDASGPVAQVLDGASEAVQQPDIWIGTLLLVAFFVLSSAALSWADVSFVMPATAAGYVLNVAAARFFLHEDVRPLRWLGAVIITFGVIFVSRSDLRTTPVDGLPAHERSGGHPA